MNYIGVMAHQGRAHNHTYVSIFYIDIFKSEAKLKEKVFSFYIDL